MSTATYNLGPVACIPLGEGRVFETGNTLIAIFRARDGRIYATEPWCPHRGGPLTDGIVAAGRVVCPLHGYTFDLATGKPSHSECRAIRTYPVRLSDQDEVLVTMRRSRLGHLSLSERGALEPEAVTEQDTEMPDARAGAGAASVEAKDGHEGGEVAAVDA